MSCRQSINMARSKKATVARRSNLMKANRSRQNNNDININSNNHPRHCDTHHWSKPRRGRVASVAAAASELDDAFDAYFESLEDSVESDPEFCPDMVSCHDSSSETEDSDSEDGTDLDQDEDEVAELEDEAALASFSAFLQQAQLAAAAAEARRVADGGQKKWGKYSGMSDQAR